MTTPPDPNEDHARQMQFIDRFIGSIPHSKTLGITYRAHGDDWAELEMAYAPSLVAYLDSRVIASGAIFALMDSTAGFSVMARRGEMQPTATIDLRLDYLHPAIPEQSVIGWAQCYKLTRNIAFVRGVAHQGDITHPVANMVGSFILSSAP